jgi:ribosomal protein S18 acetylase RimI-like enzyme
MSDSWMVQPATTQDLSRLALFLNSTHWIHRHLDWRNTFEWLGQEPFLILSQGGEIRAVLNCVPDPAAAAWIRCFAVSDQTLIQESWQKLLQCADEILESTLASLLAVGLQEWFTHLLLQNGFHTRQKIVVLEWSQHPIPVVPIARDFLIRPMELSDIPIVSQVDAHSFEPIWVNSEPALEAAYFQSAHSSVVEYENKIIGYELSTAANFNAHLARLAVLPEFRKHSLGKALVCQMLSYFSESGFTQITVNTQNDNLASLHLYQSLNFRLTYEEYPVLTQ